MVRCTFGVSATLQTLEMGAVEKILVWENLPLVRYRIEDPDTQEEQLVVQKRLKTEKDVRVSTCNLLLFSNVFSLLLFDYLLLWRR